jgi:hypothetical protein
MKQEDRPTKKESNIDSHYQQQARINRRKEAYRSIIKGEEDPEPLKETDPLSSVSTTPVMEKEVVPSSTMAREARQRRLSGTPVSNPTDDEATKIRILRAQRLRHSLKATADEEDAMEAIKARRAQQVTAERLARKMDEEERLKESRSIRDIQEERRRLDEERLQFEKAKRRAAWDQEQIRLAEEEEARMESPASSLEEEPRRSRHRKSASALEMPELSLFEEFQELLQDSGVLHACVSSCFGEERPGSGKDGKPRRRRRRSSHRN